MIRFLHAADIHLDSPLVGLSRYEGAPVDLLRGATRAAFTGLVDLAIEEAVDFLVIAGDLYDGDWRDYKTGLYFAREMGRLHDAGIPVFVLHGNHDAKSEITKQLRLPPNVRTFGDRKPQTFRLDDLNVALHGQSFRTAETLDDLAAGYPAPESGWINVGVLHTALEGHAAHAAYAPCALPQLVAHGYDYWALGHVHEFAVRHERPWIVYPGNLQGRHVRETGERGAVLVTLGADGARLERRSTDVLRWHRIDVDVNGAARFDDVVERACAALAGLARDPARRHAVAVRVALAGTTRAHGQLFGMEDQLRQEILAQAVSLTGEPVWVEKVCLETSPALTDDELRARSDAVADLRQLLAAAPADASFVASLRTELMELVGRAPAELVESVEALRAIQSGRLDEVLAPATAGLVARLAGES